MAIPRDFLPTLHGAHPPRSRGYRGLDDILGALQAGISQDQLGRMQSGRNPGGFHGLFRGLNDNGRRLLAAMLAEQQGGSPDAGAAPMFALQGDQHDLMGALSPLDIFRQGFNAHRRLPGGHGLIPAGPPISLGHHRRRRSPMLPQLPPPGYTGPPLR